MDLIVTFVEIFFPYFPDEYLRWCQEDNTKLTAWCEAVAEHQSV